MRVVRTWLLRLGWIGLLAVAALARAQPPAIAITVDPCVPVDHAKLQRLLAIELGGQANAGRGATTRVAIGCLPQGIQLQLDDALTHKSMQRLLPSASFQDETSTRLLALATAEFVVASWIELSVRRPVTLELVPPPPQTQRAAAEQIASRAVLEPERGFEQSSLSLALATRLWTQQGTPFIGASLRWLRTAAPHLALSVVGEFTLAHTRVEPFGSVSALAASLGFAVAMYSRFDDLELYTGPGAAFGLASLQGDPSAASLRGAHFAALYGGPLWFNRLAYRAGQRLRLALEFEAGLTTLPVRGGPSGSSMDAFALDGLALSACISLGWTL